MTQSGLSTNGKGVKEISTQNLISRRDIYKLALEGVVVVVSILIAFALDAWWDDKQLEQGTAEDLAIVEYELAENIRLVQVTLDILNQVVTSNKTLLAELKAHTDSETVEIEDTTILWGLFSNPTLDPSLGGTDAWIANGRLGGLDSPMLRKRLASVRGKVEDVVEEHRIAREIAVREIYPLIKDQIGDLEIIREMVSAGLNPRQSTSVQPVTGSSTISVPNSNALRFLLQTRMIWYEASIHETRDFQTELEEIQAMLKQEMLRLGREMPISRIQQ